MDSFFVIVIVTIVILLAIRIMIRRRDSGRYIEVFQTNSRTMSLPDALTRRLKEENVRYRIVYKGPPNQPVIGMSGEQFISLQAHVEDLPKARRIVSKLMNDAWVARR